MSTSPTPPASTSVFFIGATGYLGGALLSRLIASPTLFSKFSFTALCRDEARAAVLREYGIQTVLGSFADRDLIEKESEKAEMVVQLADSDALELQKAILRGMQRRKEKTGKAPILLHTSGGGILVDEETGNLTTKTFSDMDSDEIEAIPLHKPHRDLDSLTVAACTAQHIRSIIVVPVNVWGYPTGVLHERGVANFASVLIPMLIRHCLKAGNIPIVGEGKNMWSHVEVNDTADFYVLLFQSLPFPNLPGSRPELAYGRDGYYFVTAFENAMVEWSEAIAGAMKKEGLLPQLDEEEGGGDGLVRIDGKEADTIGLSWCGFNFRARCPRSLALGWKPKHVDPTGEAGSGEWRDYVNKEVPRLARLVGAL